MRIEGDVWDLPGPRTYVEEVVTLTDGGQHVAAVLPRYLASDPGRGDALALSVLDRIRSGRRIQPWPSDGPLVEAIGRQITFDEDPPVTVPDLIQHREAAGQVLVCLASDLSKEHRAELPEFVRRLTVDSMSVAADRRCTFVLIVDRTMLPRLAGSEPSEITLASSWYWNRTSRWDTAAWLAAQGVIDPTLAPALREVRSETIIELARWDWDLGTHLMGSWSGESSELLALCRDREDLAEVEPSPSVATGPVPARPPEALLEAWDRALVDVWHDSVSVAPRLLVHDRAALNGLLWAAQARVLLPWIELRRGQLEARLIRFLGKERFEGAVRHFADPAFGPEDRDFVPEVGLLHVIAKARVGSAEPRLRDQARVLWTARNHLAHLRPLPPAVQEELIRVGDSAR